VAVGSAEYWHGRATKARRVGEQMKTAEARNMMLAIADDYDRFSERARIREGRDRGF
jgi:hypothetical protein